MHFSTSPASASNRTSAGCSSTLLSLGGCTRSERKETALNISPVRQRKQQLQSCARQVQDVASPAPQWTSLSSTKSLLWSLEKLFMCISTSLAHRYGRWHSQGQLNTSDSRANVTSQELLMLYITQNKHQDVLEGAQYIEQNSQKTLSPCPSFRTHLLYFFPVHLIQSVPLY